MNILIDIIHPADANFYKNAVAELTNLGHTVTFTVLRRGRLPLIMKKEYPDYEQILLGTHKGGFIHKILGICFRQVGFFKLYLTRKFSVVSSFGFYPGFLATYLFRIPAVNFHDDKEYKMNFYCTKKFCSRFISLCSTEKESHVEVVKSFKELAFLYPARYKEDKGILKKLGVTSGKYVYVRDVTSASLNYKDQENLNYQDIFDYLHEKGYKIIYNPESEESSYKHVQKIVAKFSYEEITALRRYAALVISSGDTELRESALIGTPAIYTSERIMDVNKSIKKAGLFEIATTKRDLLAIVKKLLKKGVKEGMRKKALAFVKGYKDMTAVIVKEMVLAGEKRK